MGWPWDLRRTSSPQAALRCSSSTGRCPDGRKTSPLRPNPCPPGRRACDRSRGFGHSMGLGDPPEENWVWKVIWSGVRGGGGEHCKPSTEMEGTPGEGPCLEGRGAPSLRQGRPGFPTGVATWATWGAGPLFSPLYS